MNIYKQFLRFLCVQQNGTVFCVGMLFSFQRTCSKLKPIFFLSQLREENNEFEWTEESIVTHFVLKLCPVRDYNHISMSKVQSQALPPCKVY